MYGQISIEKRIASGMVEVALDVEGWVLLQRPMVDEEWCTFVLTDTSKRKRGDRKRTYHIGHNGSRPTLGRDTEKLFAEKPNVGRMVAAAMAERVFSLTIGL